MEFSIVLFVIRDVVNYFEKANVLRTNGTWGTFNPQIEASAIAVIEKSLKDHGVVIQAQIDSAIQMLPLILQMAGVK